MYVAGYNLSGDKIHARLKAVPRGHIESSWEGELKMRINGV
jgi:hypothetical protein